MKPLPPEFTRLLQRHQSGDASVRNQLMAAIYAELRRLAAHYMANERSGHTLQPTAVVHEAWLRFAPNADHAQNKSHFMALAAGVMKEVLIDHARKHRAVKRGGPDKSVVAFDDEIGGFGSEANDVLELCDSLERLRQLSERQALLVEYRVFGGMSFEEAAEMLQISLATAKRDWQLARAWLYRELV